MSKLLFVVVLLCLTSVYAQQPNLLNELDAIAAEGASFLESTTQSKSIDVNGLPLSSVGENRDDIARIQNLASELKLQKSAVESSKAEIRTSATRLRNLAKELQRNKKVLDKKEDTLSKISQEYKEAVAQYTQHLTEAVDHQVADVNPSLVQHTEESRDTAMVEQSSEVESEADADVHAEVEQEADAEAALDADADSENQLSTEEEALYDNAALNLARKSTPAQIAMAKKAILESHSVEQYLTNLQASVGHDAEATAAEEMAQELGSE